MKYEVVSYNDYTAKVVDSKEVDTEKEVMKWLKDRGLTPRTEMFVKEEEFALVWSYGQEITAQFIRKYYG